MLYTDMMIDLETLSTKMNAVMLSIGAVMFTVEENEYGYPNKQFYMKPNLDSQMRIGSRIQADTLKWWLKQSDEARAEFTEVDTTLPPISKVLSQLKNFHDEYKPRRIWSHGASFDLPILSYAYFRAGMEVPWKYWNERDTRTLFEVYEGDLKKFLKPDGQTVHNAVIDARNQANAVNHAWLFLKQARKNY